MIFGPLREPLAETRFLQTVFFFCFRFLFFFKLTRFKNYPLFVPPSRRSLELFFASSQNNKLLYGEPPKSPRASRKFSSPPPLSITKSSSPNRRRKLSLNIPIITGGKALDLAALGCSPNGYASMYSSVSPFSKTTLDINKLYVSSSMANKMADEAEGGKADRAEEPSLCKQGQRPPGCTDRLDHTFPWVRKERYSSPRPISAL